MLRILLSFCQLSQCLFYLPIDILADAAEVLIDGVVWDSEHAETILRKICRSFRVALLFCLFKMLRAA